MFVPSLQYCVRACVRARADCEIKIPCFCVFQIYQQDGRKDTRLRVHAASSSELKCVPARVLGWGWGGCTSVTYTHRVTQTCLCVESKFVRLL